MTTNNGETKGRPIEELSKLDSYQGMTDEEIERLTKYKLDIAMKDAAFQETMKQQQAVAHAKAEAYAAQAEHAKSKLEDLIAAPLNLATVKDGK